jgi:hypothetical protein
MTRTSGWIKRAGWLSALAAMGTLCEAADITLVADGVPKICVVVSAEAFTAVAPRSGPDPEPVYLRWAADDLTNYIAKMSGATVPLGSNAVAGLMPIYVGGAPDAPALGVKSEYGDAYAIDISSSRIALQGESARAVFYAAAMLLDRLGVRWYAPGEWGEVVPARKTLTVAAGRTEEAPDFQSRHLWAEKRWSLRNRMGGPAMAQGHGFYSLMEGGKHFADHPEYYPIVNGKPVKTQANVSSEAVADLFATNIAAMFRKGPTQWAGGNGACIGPDDGLLQDERPETRLLMSGEIDPMLQSPSITDPFLHLANGVARRLEKEFPNAYLGFYVYSTHNMPPTREEPHRMLLPIIAPISYTRYGSIGNPAVPTSMLLEEVIKGWRAKVPRMGSYLYNFNLADTAMPFTRTLYFRKSLKKLYDLGVRYSTVESMQDNWQNSIPAGWAYGRVAWDVDADPGPALDEFYTLFYGPAAEPMKAYNGILEQAYETTGAYAGNCWSMHRIFPADRVKALHACLEKAVKAVKGQTPYAQRVEIATFGLTALDCWLGARDSLNGGELAEAARWNTAYSNNWERGRTTYPGYVGRYAWVYYRGAHSPSYAAAGKIAAEGKVLMHFPDAWKARLDKDRIGIRDFWFTPAADVSGWQTLRTHGVSLDEQGLPFFRGLIWYRQDFELPKAAVKAEAIRLWLGGVDDTAHVYVNGEFVQTVTGRYFSPVDLDITAKLKRAAANVIVVAVDNAGINELGTGGLMRPALLYAPKAEGPGDGKGDGKKGSQPLFGGGQ